MLTARIETLGLRKGDRVIDIGCGEGRHCHGVQLLTEAQAVGVDLDEPSLALARERGADLEGKGPPAEFLSADAGKLPFEDASFDAAICSEVLEHVPDMAALVAEAARVLKPEGIYLAMQPNLRCEPGRYWDYYDHILPLTHLSCREAFVKSGFDVTHLVDRFIPFSTDSKLPQHPLLVKLYLRIPLVWRLLGGQFVIVGRNVAETA